MKVGDLVRYFMDGFIHIGTGIIVTERVAPMGCHHFEVFWGQRPADCETPTSWCFEDCLEVISESR